MELDPRASSFAWIARQPRSLPQSSDISSLPTRIMMRGRGSPLIFRRSEQGTRVFNAGSNFWNDAQLAVNRVHKVSDCVQPGREPGRPSDTDATADDHGSWCPYVTGQRSGQQTAERRHSQKGHRIKTHHAAAFVV